MTDVLKRLIDDHGWHLAPLGEGTIKRKSDGTKAGVHFLEGWLERGIETPTTIPDLSDTRPYLLCTGKHSGVLALDCDNSTTANIFLAMDGDNAWRIDPIGKPGVTLLYKYDEDLEKSFGTKQPPLEFDFLSNGKGMFMPTNCNETKVEWTELPEGDIPEMPAEVKNFLLNYMTAKTVVETTTTVKSDDQSNTYPALYPLVEDSLENKKLYPSLLKLLTTRKTRQLYSTIYNKKGYIAPKHIAKGGGSNYLLGVSTVLGGDESIKSDVYLKTMDMFNEALQSPLDAERLANTITSPMLNNCLLYTSPSPRDRG